MDVIFEVISDERSNTNELTECWQSISEMIFCRLQNGDDGLLASLLLAERLVATLLS